MVAYYGMSDRLKDISFYDSTGRYDYGFTKPYSDNTAEIIDEEAAAIIAEQMKRAKQILEEHAEGHHKLAEMLIEREVITSEDVENVLGPRPWKSRGDELLEEEKQKNTASEDTDNNNNTQENEKTDI
jgi:cell division protease FtsH